MFSDRLINEEDRQWFASLLKEKMEINFGIKYEEVVLQEPLLYGDFMVPNVDNKQYTFIDDHQKVN